MHSAVGSKWKSVVTVSSADSRKTLGTIFHFPFRENNTSLLSDLVPHAYSYHTHTLCKTCSVCCELRQSYPVLTRKITMCCTCTGRLCQSQSRQSQTTLHLQPYHYPELPSRRCFSVGGQQSHTHYYNVLGLTPKASQKQIKAAYYDLSKKCHPDVVQDKKSHVLFTEINEAYEVLGNIRKRRMYDKGMFSHRDQRVYDDDDYTQSYKKKASQSPFERGDRPQPPTGKSKIYNFDEFYKQHYNDIRERRKQEYQQFQRYKQMNDFHTNQRRQQQSRMGYPLLVPVCLSLLMIAFVLNNHLYDYDNVTKYNDDKNR